jgi:hypothetical protein
MFTSLTYFGHRPTRRCNVVSFYFDFVKLGAFKETTFWYFGVCIIIPKYQSTIIIPIYQCQNTPGTHFEMTSLEHVIVKLNAKRAKSPKAPKLALSRSFRVRRLWGCDLQTLLTYSTVCTGEKMSCGHSEHRNQQIVTRYHASNKHSPSRHISHR